MLFQRQKRMKRTKENFIDYKLFNNRDPNSVQNEALKRLVRLRFAHHFHTFHCHVIPKRRFRLNVGFKNALFFGAV